jgi:hypothetical protein
MRKLFIACLLVAISVGAFLRWSSLTISPAPVVDNAAYDKPIKTSITVRDIPVEAGASQVPTVVVEQGPVETTLAIPPKPLSSNLEPTPGAIAREALSFVGINPEAETIWFDVINNLSTPAKERKNLIEDLDTDGFQSAKHPTSVDLALIQNRLAIIEKYAPSTTDPINAAAFQEAKKDLSKMLKKANTPIQ